MKAFWQSFFSKATLAVTVGTGAALSSGVITNRTAAYIGIGAAVLQAFQPRVQQNQNDLTVVNNALVTK